MKYPEAEHLVHKLELQAALLNLEASTYDNKARELQQLAAISRKQVDELKSKIDVTPHEIFFAEINQRPVARLKRPIKIWRQRKIFEAEIIFVGITGQIATFAVNDGYA